MVRKILLAAVALLVFTAAPAAAQYPSLVVQPGRVVVGGQVTVTGQGCTPGSTVVITLQRVGADSGVVVATVTAGPDGTFTASFMIPEGTAPGMYDVISECDGHTQRQPLEVLAQSVDTDPGGGGTGAGGGGSLPRTGSNLNGVGLFGAGLLAVGGLLLLAARKRRNATA